MVRKLKYHEQKLLKKVDFISWECDNNLSELKVMKKFGIEKREEYTTYNKMSREIRRLAHLIKDLEDNDPFKVKFSEQLLNKLYENGVVPHQRSLEVASTVSASSLCRRRLPYLLVKHKMAERVKMAHQFVEEGHIRIGPSICLDPARLISKDMEDFITWTDTSAIKKHVLAYNELKDDFDVE